MEPHDELSVKAKVKVKRKVPQFNHKPDLQLVRKPELRALLGLGRSQTDEVVKQPDFPKPVPLSGRPAWREADLLAWMTAPRILKRDAR